MVAAGTEARPTDFSEFRVFRWNMYDYLRGGLGEVFHQGFPRRPLKRPCNTKLRS